MIKDPFSKKNNKFFYYLTGAGLEIQRRFGHKKSREKWVRSIENLDQDILQKRLAYYNKQDDSFLKPKDKGVQIKDLQMPKKGRTYYFDLIEFTRFFPDALSLNYEFGDITKVPNSPTLVKSRPLYSDNKNSVLFKFNKVRHFLFLKDRIPFHKKENKLIWRAHVHQEHRRDFLKEYFDHPMCDVGQINSHSKYNHWLKQKISIPDFLNHKFIWCQEGFDVATNLKWVMSSNSIPVMPKPKFETWFMEGTLQPNEHFALVKDDFSDLEDRLQYYLDYEKEAVELVENASNYAKKFQNEKLEKALGILVLDKFFTQSGQQKPLFPKWY